MHRPMSPGPRWTKRYLLSNRFIPSFLMGLSQSTDMSASHDPAPQSDFLVDIGLERLGGRGFDNNALIGEFAGDGRVIHGSNGHGLDSSTTSAACRARRRPPPEGGNDDS